MNQSRAPHKSSISVLISFLILLLFTGLSLYIYSNTFNSPFILDDVLRIEENPLIRVTQFSIPKIIKAGLASSKMRPLAFITFALDYSLHRYDVFGYHLINIIIHILSGFFLFLFLKTTFTISIVQAKDKHTILISFFAALIWLVHPIQTQSVTYIVQRMNGLAALFFILAFWLYVKGRLSEQAGKKWGWFGGAALAWILALGSKQNAAILPIFIFLYEWYFFQDLGADWLKRNIKYVFLALFAFGLIALLYLGTDPFEKLSSLKDFANKEFTVFERVMTQFRVVVHYISLILFPYPSRLNLDYDFPLSTSLINPLTTLLSLLIIVGLIALAVYLAKRERLISFCILWFFGNLVIESSIIPLAIIFEHRNYLPSMMVCLIPVVMAYRYIKIDWLRIGLLSILVVVLSIWTYQRNRVWENNITLWSDVVKKSPAKARPHFNLGSALSEQGRDVEAIPQYQRALEIAPDLAQPHINLGQALERQNKFEQAAEHYRAALKSEPDLPEANNNLGTILAKQGKTAEAIQYYRKALKIRPHFALAHFNLANSLVEAGKIKAGIQHYYQALQFEPGYAEAHANLGSTFLRLGQTEKAIKHYAAALQLNPNLVEARSNLGIALMQQGKIEAAVKQFQKALALAPGSKTAENNLSRALAIQKGLETEISRLQALLKDNPDSIEIHFQLGNLYFRKGEQSRAIQQYKKVLQLNSKFVPALNNLALVTAANGEFYKALTIFMDVLKFHPDDAEAHYNIACMYSRLERVDESIEWLKKAIDKGYQNWQSIKTDDDLDYIREFPAYRELIQGH